jgi:hypothetical protein
MNISKQSSQTLKDILEFDESSKQNKSIHDVVIPKNGGGKEGCYTDGFKVYTHLVYRSSNEYHTLPPRKKREFAIDRILMPLLNENRKIYRYNKKMKAYVMMDLTDKKALQNFTTKVVMQKFRDVTKQFDDSDNINSNIKRKILPTRPVEHKQAHHKKAKKVDPNPVPEKSDQVSIQDPWDDFYFDFGIKSGSIGLNILSDSTSLASRCSNLEEDYDLEEDTERPVDISSQFSPLLSILLSHPYAQQFRETSGQSLLNLDAIKRGLDNGSYKSTLVVERDLKRMLKGDESDGTSTSTTECGSNDFLALVTNYCGGLRTSA